jgi:hypothetical protein
MRRERGRRLGLDPSFRVQAAKLDGALTGRGITIRVGDTWVTALPNHRNDTSDDRPRLSVADGPGVRIVALDAGQRTLADAALAGGDFVVPPGTAYLAVSGVPAVSFSPARRASTSYAGWQASTMLTQIAPDSYLGPRTVVRASGAPTRRRRAEAAVAVTTAAEATRDASIVETTLPADTSAVVVTMEGAQTAACEPAPDVSVAVGGTVRRPLEPEVVRAGRRSYAVFAVEPGREPIDVAVAPRSGQRLVGVFGAAVDPGTLAADLVARGAETLVGAPPSSAVSGTTRVVWAGPPGVKRRGRKSRG